MPNDARHTVRIDPAFYREIEEIVRHSLEFNSVEDYVNAILRELLAVEGSSGQTDDVKLKKRLRELGYL